MPSGATASWMSAPPPLPCTSHAERRRGRRGSRWPVRRSCSRAQARAPSRLRAPPVPTPPAGYDRPHVALEPGLTRSDEFLVEERMLTDVGGSLAVPVLSTPSMIGVMERNAARLARAHLADGKATVGFEVCVRHVASALQGASCRVSASLREVIDGR